MKIYIAKNNTLLNRFLAELQDVTPLGVSHASIPAFQPVIATILRTGLLYFLTTLTRQKMAFVKCHIINIMFN